MGELLRKAYQANSDWKSAGDANTDNSYAKYELKINTEQRLASAFGVSEASVLNSGSIHLKPHIGENLILLPSELTPEGLAQYEDHPALQNGAYKKLHDLAQEQGDLSKFITSSASAQTPAHIVLKEPNNSHISSDPHIDFTEESIPRSRASDSGVDLLHEEPSKINWGDDLPAKTSGVASPAEGISHSVKQASPAEIEKSLMELVALQREFTIANRYNWNIVELPNRTNQVQNLLYDNNKSIDALEQRLFAKQTELSNLIGHDIEHALVENGKLKLEMAGNFSPRLEIPLKKIASSGMDKFADGYISEQIANVLQHVAEHNPKLGQALKAADVNAAKEATAAGKALLKEAKALAKTGGILAAMGGLFSWGKGKTTHVEKAVEAAEEAAAGAAKEAKSGFIGRIGSGISSGYSSTVERVKSAGSSVGSSVGGMFSGWGGGSSGGGYTHEVPKATTSVEKIIGSFSHAGFIGKAAKGTGTLAGLALVADGGVNALVPDQEKSWVERVARGGEAAVGAGLAYVSLTHGKTR